jgi:hypothetical protein
MIFAKEMSKYKLDILVLGVQEVRWDRDVSESTYFYGMGNENRELTGIFFSI